MFIFVINMLENLRTSRRRRLAGAETSLRDLQGTLNPRCDRVRAAKHAPRGPFHVLERRHSLAQIVEREANSRAGDFHDARVALTAAPTPEPVFGNGTAATRRRARRHPEGTLFLCFLVALLVLVAVLGAPCRRSLGDAVLLPDEEDM